MCLHQEADLGLVPVAINLERYQAIEFSGSLGGDDSGILVKYPEPSVSFTGAFDVFSIGVSFNGFNFELSFDNFHTNEIVRYEIRMECSDMDRMDNFWSSDRCHFYQLGLRDKTPKFWHRRT
jgi:hypothetical protein